MIVEAFQQLDGRHQDADEWLALYRAAIEAAVDAIDKKTP